MTEVCDFIFSLARAKKTGKEIKPLIDTVYGDNTLSISQINLIIKGMKEGKSFTDQRHSNTKKNTSGPMMLWPHLLPWRKTGA
jgi:hypothetical protein